ncbi:MAG: AMP-binding protein [Nitrospinaceae bacterium]
MNLDPILPQERTDAMRSAGWWQDENLLALFDAALTEKPDEVAVVDFRVETGEKTSVTYRQLNDKATRIALALAHYGIEKQDVVSVQLPNWWEFVATNLACLRIGAVCNPLMPIFRQRELAFMVDYAESKVLIVPKLFRGFDHEEMIDGLRGQLPHLKHLFAVGGRGDTSFEDNLLNHDLPDTSEVLFQERQLNPLDVIMLMYTSGTTGMPKGVMHCANTFTYNIKQMSERWALDSQDTVFMGSPVAHLTGFMYGMWMPIILKAKMIFLDAWNVNDAWQLIAEEGASFAMGATPFLADLTNSERALECNTDRFRLFACGGAPIPRVLAKSAVEKLDIHLLALWGMTECGVVTSTRLGDPKEKIFGTDGIAIPGCTVKIVDQQGQPVASGVEGRLLENGPSTFIGYLKRPEDYGVDNEGYFDTGDLATMDHDGFIRITGRSKDIIIRGGENIPVVEIENLLYKHPKIIDCAVVAMPNDRLGELGCCFATIEQGSAFSFDDMIDFLRDGGMARNYWPEHLEVVTEMPRTASGKIQKYELRILAESIGRVTD